MAYCATQTLSDIAVDCTSNVGGVSVVAIRNRADIEAITVTDDAVSAITLASGDDVPNDAAVLAFRSQTCQLSSEATIDDVAGVHFYTNTLAFRFNKMNATKRASIKALAHAETIAIVKDNNGTYWLVGYDEPLRASAMVGTTGTAYTDANEYTPTLACMSAELPLTVSSAAVATFLGDAVI